MPKLPSYGSVDYQRAGHPGAPLDLDGYGKGTQAIGAALFKTGSTLAGMAEERADREDKLTQAHAGSTLLLGLGELKRKAQEDQDPNDFDNRYVPQVKQLYEQSFASIRDPYQRQLFEARMRPHMQTDIDSFTKRGKTLRDDVDKAGSDQRLFGIGQSMDATKDDAEKQRLMGEAHREIDGRVQRGWLTREQAGEIKRDWANKRAVTWVESKPPAERMRILETRPTPTGLVPPVNGTFVGGPASHFGARRGIGRLHAGVDWQAPDGSPAATAIAGKVVYTGNHGGYGNMVDVLGTDGNVHRYALHGGDVGVKIGDAVTAGQKIGTVGGGHVHNEIIRKDTPAWQAATAGQFGGTSRRPGAEPQTIDPAEVYGLKPGTKVSSGTALAAPKQDHPVIRLLAPGQRQVLYERAEREFETQRRTTIVDTKSLIDDDFASIGSTGQPIGTLTRDRVAAVYGDEMAAAWEQARGRAKQYYDTVSKFPNMTAEEIMAELEKVRPKGGKPGFVQEETDFNRIAGAAKPYLDEAAKVQADSQKQLDDWYKQEAAAHTNEEKRRIAALKKDDIESIERSGVPIAALNRKAIAGAFDEENADAWEAARRNAMALYEAKQKLRQTPTVGMADAVRGFAPQPGWPGYKDAADTHDKIVAEAKRITDLRLNDPAAAVAEDPVVAEAQRGVDMMPNDPQAWRALVAARLKAQRVIGIPETSLAPITNDEGVKLMDPVLEAPAGQEVVALRAVAKRFDDLFGQEHADKAFTVAIGAAGVSKEVREVAGGLLRRLGLGKPVSPADLQKVEDAKAEEKQNKTVAPLLSAPAAPAEPVDPDNPRFYTPPPANPNDPPERQDARITPNDRQLLIAEPTPKRMEQFDKVYGRGAAMRVLEATGKAPKK